jgi:hypothetical protein
MKIENGYIATSEAMAIFGLKHRNWLFRHGKEIRQFSQVEKGRNKVYYCVEDIQKQLIKYSHENNQNP